MIAKEMFEKLGYKTIVQLQQKVEQLENIRKEAVEYVLKNKLYRFKYDHEELFEITTDKKAKDDLLNILNKESDKELYKRDKKEIERLNNIINEDFDKFNDELNTFKWLENDFKEHSIHYYQLECLVEYLKQLKENK